MKTLTIVATTDRPGSNTLRFAKHIKPMYEELGLSVKLISLEDFPIADVAGGRYGADIPSIKKFNDDVLNTDGILFVIPEYNGSFPGIFKLFIDYLPFPNSFLGMPMAFVGIAAGSFGGLRAVEQAEMIVGYRNAYVFPERVFIAEFNKVYTDQDGLSKPLYKQLLKSQVKNFATYLDNNFPKLDLG
ncbi:MAG: NAD(P)H-dependent oxidoreductase [Balneolales bacterium]|nr:NAD(P)H-dependent oxidoreductase [Balneolales bacterium]